MAARTARKKSSERMNAQAIRQFLIEYFQAHAVKGDLKPSRTYEVIERTSSKIKITTRNGHERSVQTLFADLVTCKSLKYGEFRRVDLFWGAERKEQEKYSAPSISSIDITEDDSFPAPEFTSSGAPLPVDAFMKQSLAGRPSRKSRKEKAS
ncbi:MAG TPA: hypothetical protein PKW95_24560 [bacterium]|nr:hypothetical protein [bacterium]